MDLYEDRVELPEDFNKKKVDEELVSMNLDEM